MEQICTICNILTKHTLIQCKDYNCINNVCINCINKCRRCDIVICNKCGKYCLKCAQNIIKKELNYQNQVKKSRKSIIPILYSDCNQFADLIIVIL